MSYQDKARDLMAQYKMGFRVEDKDIDEHFNGYLADLNQLFKEEVEQIIGLTIPITPVKDVTNQRELIEDHHKAIAVNELIYKQRARLNKTIEEKQ